MIESSEGCKENHDRELLKSKLYNKLVYQVDMSGVIGYYIIDIEGDMIIRI